MHSLRAVALMGPVMLHVPKPPAPALPRLNGRDNSFCQGTEGPAVFASGVNPRDGADPCVSRVNLALVRIRWNWALVPRGWESHPNSDGHPLSHPAARVRS